MIAIRTAIAFLFLFLWTTIVSGAATAPSAAVKIGTAKEEGFDLFYGTSTQPVHRTYDECIAYTDATSQQSITGGKATYISGCVWYTDATCQTKVTPEEKPLFLQKKNNPVKAPKSPSAKYVKCQTITFGPDKK